MSAATSITSDDREELVERPSIRKRRTIASSFQPRHNSFNAIRIVLASCVLFSHAITLGGFGNEHIIGSETLGDLAVDGFFCLSGFLITRSAQRTSSIRRFFWHRFLRIYPGLWLCLLVTAFIIAPLGWMYLHPGYSLSLYFHAPYGPVQYVAGNVFANDTLGLHRYFLGNLQMQISGTPTDVPYVGAWSGQLWTLEFELISYVLIGIFAFVRLLKLRYVIALLWIANFAVAWLNFLHPAIFNYDIVYWEQVVRLVGDFFAGALIYLFADKIPDSRLLFLGFLAVFVAGMFAVNNTDNLDVLCGPCMAYLVIWLGIHLPFQRIGRKSDLSYGIYIYAFPVLQIFATWGLYGWGYVPFALTSFVVTVLFAWMSWEVIERRAMGLKDWQPTFRFNFGAIRRQELSVSPEVSS